MRPAGTQAQALHQWDRSFVFASPNGDRTIFLDNNFRVWLERDARARAEQLSRFVRMIGEMDDVLEGDPVALVPNRNRFLLTGSRNHPALKALLEFAQSVGAQNHRSSSALLAWRDNRWNEFLFEAGTEEASRQRFVSLKLLVMSQEPVGPRGPTMPSIGSCPYSLPSRSHDYTRMAAARKRGPRPAN
jgi:hypothetical protein